MGGPWVVHEGYLQVKNESVASPRAVAAALRVHRPPPLVERYVVLTMSRKLELFDGPDPETRARVDAAQLAGFCGWDGDGLLQADAYGLELKVDKRRAGPGRMFLAAFNRLDLEKWCRAFLAVLDPDSAAGQEVRRERRRARKEEKRLEEEREEKLRRWREKQARAIDEERARLLAREEEISNMTPLERVDGLGSLDDATARVLEKRKLRLQRRQAPTTGRVNKSAYRRRMEEAAGGKTDNVHPLQTKTVEQRSKVRVELPPPGQFIIAADAPHRHRSASSGSGSLSDDGSERSSLSSRMSGHSNSARVKNDRRFSLGGVPPPPPPPSQSMRRLSTASTSSQFVPPPPPFPPPLSARASFDDIAFSSDSRPSVSSSSFRSSSFDTMSGEAPAPRSSMAHDRRRLSNVNGDKLNVQSSLAAIMGGGRRPPPRPSPKTRRDSFESTASSVANGAASHRRHSRARDVRSPKAQENSEPTMANAFAASLAAIRRNRADTVDDSSAVMSPASVPNGKARNRTRDSQLSAEGKSLLKQAIEGGHASEASNKKAQNGRKGLFDDSSDDDDDADSGLFGASRREQPSPISGRQSEDHVRHSMGMRGAGRQSTGRRAGDGIDSDSDGSGDSRSTAGLGPPLFARRSGVGGAPTSPKSATSSTSGFVSATPPSHTAAVSVAFVSSAVQSVGKKLDGVFTFAFRTGSSAEHTFSFTYSQFEEIHARLTTAFPSSTLPKFPSKHRLRNNTKPENLQKRAQEFLEYFQQLVAVPGVASSSRFQFEYQIEGAFARALLGEPSTSASNGSTKKRASIPAASPASSTSRSPAARREKPANKPVKKQLFGDSDDSDSNDSESESDSDTSVNTPESPSLQDRHAAPMSSSRRPPPSSKQLSDQRRRRQQDASRASSKASSMTSDAPARRKSRASSRASHMSLAAPPSPEAPPKIAKAVPGLPPGRPNPFAGSRGDLLAAIRKGAELRKTGDGEGESAESATGSKPAAVARPPPPAPMTQATSISEAITNAMAARRIHVEYEETHSDADDSDDDWDD